jgi:hypothetical protein
VRAMAVEHNGLLGLRRTNFAQRFAACRFLPVPQSPLTLSMLGFVAIMLVALVGCRINFDGLDSERDAGTDITQGVALCVNARALRSIRRAIDDRGRRARRLTRDLCSCLKL